MRSAAGLSPSSRTTDLGVCGRWGALSKCMEQVADWVLGKAILEWGRQQGHMDPREHSLMLRGGRLSSCEHLHKTPAPHQYVQELGKGLKLSKAHPHTPLGQPQLAPHQL